MIPPKVIFDDVSNRDVQASSVSLTCSVENNEGNVSIFQESNSSTEQTPATRCSSEHPRRTTQSVCSVSCPFDSYHEPPEDDQGRASGRDQQAGRNTTQQVEQGGADHSFVSTLRGEGHPLRSSTKDGASSDGGGTQPGQPQESRLGGVLHKDSGSTHFWKSHNPADAEVGPDPHLRDVHSGCQRPSGLRQGSEPFLRRDQGGQAVLPVGDADSQGRRLLPSASSSGTLVGDRASSHLQDRRDEDEPGDLRARASHYDRSQGQQDRSLQCGQHRQYDQFHSSHVGQLGGGGKGSQGRSGRFEGESGGAKGPQEGQDQQRWQFQCSESARSLEPTGSDASDSSHEGRRTLCESAARHLEQQSWSLAPDVFQSLVQEKRTILLEVACCPNSRLSSAIQEKAGYSDAAIRCSHWNNCDLGSSDGVKLILQNIDQKQPLNVWISTECGPFSPMQNLNQRTEDQRLELAAKRQTALRQYVGASCVAHYAIQKGSHVHWEWSQKSHAWRLPLIQKLQEKYQFWVSVTNGCQVNLRDPKSGKLLHKGWKVMTTHKRVSELLDLPCRCPRSVEHAKCEGNLTGQSAYYTPEMVKRVVLGMCQEMNLGSLTDEMNGKTTFCSSFGVGVMCVCEDLKYHGSQQECGACVENTFLEKRETAMVHGETENKTVETEKGDKGISDEHIKHQLYRLHAATGHGHVRHMIDALQKRGASERVLKLAKQFVCPICQEKGRVQHKHVSTLEPLPPKWSTISADGGKWIHPVTGEHVEFLLIIDESSRFRTGKIMCKGKHKTMNAGMFLSYLDEGWCQYFGTPQAIRLDPAGAFRSNEVERYCDLHGIYLDFIPGEAHWKLGVCEQAIQGTKELMNKLVQEEPQLPVERALSTALRTFNTREVIRGFTPIQHALGRSPDSMGRCIQTLTGQSIEELIPNQGPEFEENIERMKTAETAHVEWVAQQRMVRALNSRGNRLHDYHPGDLVYYWRKQLSGQRGQSQQQKQGCYLGPGRVLVTETKRDPHGNLSPGSSVWIIRGRRLVKCSVEQLRHATQREQLLEHLSHEDEKKAPWTFQRLTEGLGGNEYEDISQDGGPPSTSEDIPTLPMETEEIGRRIHGKRPEQEIRQNREAGSDERPASRQRTGEPETKDAFVAKTPWYDYTMEHSRREADGEVFWTDQANAIEVEVTLPETKRSWKQFETDTEAYFIGALKRRAVEVNERRLSPEDRQRFKDAKMVEVKNYVAARAFEALPPHLRPPEEKAIKMRWLLTWKLKDDGTTKPKARAILLGYQDPQYEERETTSPVMTRQSRQLLLAASGRYQWQVWKGDVTGAFLQGREYPKELYCIPCDEICEAMGLETGAITRVRRGCYGLVDAPLEWYRSVSAFLDQLGLIKSWSDPCTWLWKPGGKLRGLISGHVDDFLFAGPQKDKDWITLTGKIKEHFKWTDWETKSFVQCGVKVEEQPDGSFHLSQEQYIEKVPEIYVSASRKKQIKEDTTDREKSQLRATLGALSWSAQQIAPHLSAEVGLLLSEVTTSTVETLLKANRLVHFAKARKDHKMIIHAIPESIPVGFYTWADAAGQNRRDGSSTQGVFVGLGPTSLSQGEVSKVIPIAWHSNKIERPCRSPGAAESHAAIAGEDYMYHARFQWSEMHSTEVDIFDSDSLVRKIPGCLISDSRNVYDKLQTSELTIRGAERKTDLNLLCLKHAQRVTNLELRWVHSEAQLGNSLTKGGSKELDLFYGLSFRWRLVADEEMRSARKRRQQGIGVLQPQQSTTQQQNSSQTTSS